MTQDWTIRVENEKEILHLNGVDYVFVLNTFEKYMAGYPDTVQNEILEADGNKIRVRLGFLRYVLQEDGDIETLKDNDPVNVWCVPLDEEASVPNINQDNDDGFITG